MMPGRRRPPPFVCDIPEIKNHPLTFPALKNLAGEKSLLTGCGTAVNILKYKNLSAFSALPVPAGIAACILTS
jgi:hypothetical protein